MDAFAEKLLGGAIRAISWTKMAANAPLWAMVSQHLETFIALEGHSNRTADHQEAVIAFNEKREPRFTGK